jgi:hypothetical protein
MANHPARDLLRLASRVGQQSYGKSGAQWMRELTITHALAALRRRGYDDEPLARLKRHLMIVGPAAAGKSSASSKFLNKYARVVPTEGPPAPREEYDRALFACREAFLRDEEPDPRDWETVAPRMFEVTGRTTWEKMTGSFGREGEIVVSGLMGSDYCYVTELYQLLGALPQDIQKRAMDLYTVLEEGRSVVELIKGVTKVGGKRAESNLKTAEAWRMQYHPSMGRLEYTTQATFIACTTPIEKRDKNGEVAHILRELGFLSRYHISAYETGSGGQLDDMHKMFQKADPDDEWALRRALGLLWTTTYDRVCRPVEAQQAPVVAEVHDHAKWAHEAFGTEPHSFANNRVRNGLTNLIPMAASVRHSLNGAPPRFLVYEKEDVDVAVRETRIAMNRRIVGELPKYNPERVDREMEAEAMLVSFVRAQGISPTGYRIQALHTFFAQPTGSNGGRPNYKKAAEMLTICHDNHWLKPTDQRGSFKVDTQIIKQARKVEMV